jgi:hypothetical protein
MYGCHHPAEASKPPEPKGVAKGGGQVGPAHTRILLAHPRIKVKHIKNKIHQQYLCIICLWFKIWPTRAKNHCYALARTDATPLSLLLQAGTPQNGVSKQTNLPKMPHQRQPPASPEMPPQGIQTPLLKGTHPAWSKDCSILKEAPVDSSTPILPIQIIDPPTAFADHPS